MGTVAKLSTLKKEMWSTKYAHLFVVWFLAYTAGRNILCRLQLWQQLPPLMCVQQRSGKEMSLLYRVTQRSVTL